VTATLILTKDVDVAVKVGVRGNAAWLADNLSTLNIFALGTTKK